MPVDQDFEGPGFKHATIREVYRLVQDPNTRVSAPALHLSSEYLKLFTAEAIHRAAEVAQTEKQDEQSLQLLQSKGKGKDKGKVTTKELEESPALLEVWSSLTHSLH
ncbi:hypothetical protein JCM16303_004139 [Sporobolomyces ruberrimus]